MLLILGTMSGCGNDEPEPRAPRGEPSPPESAEPTPADTTPTAASDRGDSPLPEFGRYLYAVKGCAACHAIRPNVAEPSVAMNLYDVLFREIRQTDGSDVVADHAFLRRAIVDPQHEVTDGYVSVMPVIPMTEHEVNALVAYIAEAGPEGRSAD